jgi:3-dehydroquinate dehydratase II
MTQRVLLINGPNLNLLGTREPHRYGTTTYLDLIDHLRQIANALSFSLECRQSNHEGALIDWIHAAQGDTDGLIINPGAYSHTSIAIRDALIAVNLPTIEIHISNLAQREPFRHHSYLSDVVIGTLSGFGVYGYELALNAMAQTLKK